MTQGIGPTVLRHRAGFGRREQGFGSKAPLGRRSADRANTPLAAFFATRSRSHGVALVDLSSTGAKMRGASLPSLGEELFLTIAGARFFATVTRIGQGECGLKFEPPLGLQEIADIGRALPRSWTCRPTCSVQWTTGTRVSPAERTRNASRDRRVPRQLLGGARPFVENAATDVALTVEQSL